MEDFLGTTIQFAEKEPIALEQEHALNMEITVCRLIESGFLDSDYDGSSGTYSDCSSSSSVSDIESIQPNESNESIKSSDGQQATQYIEKNSFIINENHITYNIFTYYSLVLLFVCCLMISVISSANPNQHVLDYDLFDLHYVTNTSDTTYMYTYEEMHDNNGRIFENECRCIQSKFILLYGFVDFWCQQTKVNNQLMNDISPWVMEDEYEHKIYRQQNQNMDKQTTEADTEYLKVSLWVALSLLLSDHL
eukprot:UN02389